MEQLIREYGLFIVYVLAALWMVYCLDLISKDRGQPSSLDPEPRPSLWQMPGWYFLLVALVVVGYFVFKACGGPG